MGLRLKSEFHSSTGKLYKIEIHDEDFSSTVKTFTVAGDGFTLNYAGETDDIVSPIISSNCIINAYNENNAFDLFITDLKLYQEGRFLVKILLHDGTNYNDFWNGVLMQDLVQEEDQSKPRIFQLTAVDGISRLSNIDYTETGNTTIETFIEEAVDGMGVDDLYTDTDILYKTCFNLWDTNQTYSTSTDNLTQIRFNASVYAPKNEEGVREYSKILDVLKELCIVFGARFYQQDGVYIFEQYLERDNTSRNVFSYTKTGSLSGNATVSDDVTLAGTTSGGARLAGNSYNYLPALKKVSITYNQERVNNFFLHGFNFTSSTAAEELGFIADDNNAQLLVTGQLIYRWDWTGSGATQNITLTRPVFRMQLKIEDSNNPGTYYYLKRNFTATLNSANLYGATSWTTTASYYYLDAGIAEGDANGLYVQRPFNVVTPPLPVEGDATIDVDFYQNYSLINLSTSVPSNYTEIWTAKQVRVTYTDDQGGLSSVTVFAATNTDTNINSNLTLALGNVHVSDSLGMLGSFYVYDGSAWIPSEDWRRGNTGTYADLLKLLCKEVLSLHKRPIERYNGTIVGPFNFGQRYVWDSSYWVNLGGTYNANFDEWAAEWFKLNKVDTGITTDTPTGQGGGAVFAYGASTQQGTDNVQNLQELRVHNTTAVGSTSVAEFTTTDRVNVTVNSISGNPGGSETISHRNHFNFISYSGANGTYTINLPSAEDGVILRFKTDDTIGANKNISLVPQSGERIDAEASYSLDRSYDGITLLGFSGNYFIIQKKEK